ncbi:hypothetical protein Patl1_00871 [Pistacia atlantica]|uniref:Uncharacterized protein n=1 Tax=Pistacia atlantica TaxID=434234 RepID=A0ACC1C5Y9_9ROSI|nr:hypothetical protein Patl1_00871 [Pistacia atlantica]
MAYTNCIILALSLFSLLSLHSTEARLSLSPSSAPTASHHPSYKGPVPPAVKTICDRTEFPDVCISTIVPLLGPSQKTDPISILQLGLKALTTETHKAIRQTKKLFKDPKTTPEIGDCLNVCLESYDNVLESNDKAISSIPGKDVVPLDGTITMIYDCDDAFTELTTEKSPLEKINKNLIKIAKNNVGISNAFTA